VGIPIPQLWYVNVPTRNDNPNATTWFAKELPGVSIHSLREHSAAEAS